MEPPPGAQFGATKETMERLAVRGIELGSGVDAPKVAFSDMAPQKVVDEAVRVDQLTTGVQAKLTKRQSEFAAHRQKIDQFKNQEEEANALGS